MSDEKVCISPACGRPVGSKGNPHHKWSCGKSSCDAYAEGYEAATEKTAYVGARIRAMGAILDALGTVKGQEDAVARLLTVSVDAVLRERERCAKLVEMCRDQFIREGCPVSKDALTEEGSRIRVVVMAANEIAKKIREVP